MYSKTTFTIHKKHTTHWKAALFPLVAVMSFPSVTHAEAKPLLVNFKHSLSFEYAPETTGRALSQTVPAILAKALRNEATITVRGLEYGQLKFGVSLETRHYADQRYALSNKASVRMEYRAKPSDKLQWRVQFAYDRAWLGEELNFDRIALGLRMQYRHTKQHTTRAHLRYRYRNQNEARFTGYDQSEYLLSLAHDYRPAHSNWRFSATTYFERRAAEQARFSYKELGLGLAARYKLSKKTELRGSVKAFTRQYQAGTGIEARKDTRLEVKLGFRHKVSKSVSAFGHIGVRRNQSTVVTRSYSEPIAALGLTYKW